MGNYLPYSEYDGKINMQIDESILNSSIENKLNPTLRIYGWTKPTVTLGRNQDMKNINLKYCHENGINIVKRPTGGRALLHHKEITYCFVAPKSFLKNGDNVLRSYAEISEALINAFNEIGIQLNFPEHKKIALKNTYCMAISTGSDLSYKGKKLIGSAQFRKHDYILQHGSILLDIDYELLHNVFSIKDTIQNLITLKQIDPALIDINFLVNALKTGFERKFRLSFKEQKVIV